MRIIALATSLLFLSACQDQPGEIYWDGGTQLLAESCPAHAPEGFAYVPIQQVRDVLQARHEGERVAANLLPNILYCSYVSGSEEKPCYRFSGLNITPNRALQFCLEGESAVDVVIEDVESDDA